MISFISKLPVRLLNSPEFPIISPLELIFPLEVILPEKWCVSSAELPNTFEPDVNTTDDDTSTKSAIISDADIALAVIWLTVKWFPIKYR